MPYSVGTCAWTDHENFYPPGTKPNERLAYYARFFPLVEVDSTFYRLMPRRNFALWAERTPPDFRFNVKAYRVLTGHTRHMTPEERAMPLEDAFGGFRAQLEPMAEAGKLRALHFQFPPWFVKRADNVAYLDTVRAAYPDFTVAVEFRHRSWLGDDEAAGDTLALLRDRGFCHVVCDEPQAGAGTVPPVVAVTNPELVVFRFHGRNRKAWFKATDNVAERHQYYYSPEELRGWAAEAGRVAQQARDVQLLFNNNWRSYAIENAWQMARLLDLDYPDPLEGRLVEDG